MKIVFIGGRDITLLGGIENYMFNLTAHLQRQGYSCVVYCESNHSSHENLNGVNVYFRKGFSSNLLTKPMLALFSTIHALRVHPDAEVFHYNAWPPAIWGWLPRVFGKKVILQGHGFEWKRTKYSRFARSIHHIMEFFTAEIAQYLTVVSEEQCLYFQKYYHRKSVVIPCAVDFQKRIPEDEAQKVLRKYQLEKQRYFLFLGRLINEKNPDILIKSFKQFCSDSGYKLVLAGNLAEQTLFGKKIRNMVEADSIVLTGPIYGEEKLILLQQSGCFCLPSTMEGLPISLLEAMEAGCSIICSDIPACLEAVGTNAIAVPPENVNLLGNAMKSFIDSPTILSQYREANLERIRKQFNWDTITQEYIKFINRITKKK